jgi:hypothetical protein
MYASTQQSNSQPINPSNIVSKKILHSILMLRTFITCPFYRFIRIEIVDFSDTARLDEFFDHTRMDG